MHLGSLLKTIGMGGGAKAREQFRLALFHALQDGELTDEEIADLEAKKKEYGLSEADIREAHLAFYTAAFLSAKADAVITEDEWVWLEDIQRTLGLSDRDVAANKKELLRLHILTEVRAGNLPIIAVPHLLLKKDEYSHWSEASSWVRDGGGAVSDGLFIVTNKRLLFEGTAKSFASSLKSLIGIKVRGDVLVLDETGRKPKHIRLSEPANREILVAILTKLVQGS